MGKTASEKKSGDGQGDTKRRAWFNPKFIQRDLQIGLFLFLLMGLLLSPRFLPPIEVAANGTAPGTVSTNEARDKATPPALTLPPIEPPAAATLSHAPDAAAPAASVARPPQSASGLTDILPEGYVPQSSKSSEVRTPTKTSSPAPPPGSKSKDNPDAPKLTLPPVDAGGEIVTEFVPYHTREKDAALESTNDGGRAARVKEAKSGEMGASPRQAPSEPDSAKDEPGRRHNPGTSAADNGESAREGKTPTFLISAVREATRRLAGGDPGPTKKNDREARAPAQPTPAGDNAITIRAFDRPAKEPSTSAPPRAKIPPPSASRPKAGPIHPYFQRYLDDGEYYVRQGDTLASIAYRLYGTEVMADALRRANAHLVGSAEPKPGTRLKLP